MLLGAVFHHENRFLWTVTLTGTKKNCAEGALTENCCPTEPVLAVHKPWLHKPLFGSHMVVLVKLITRWCQPKLSAERWNLRLWNIRNSNSIGRRWTISFSAQSNRSVVRGIFESIFLFQAEFSLSWSQTWSEKVGYSGFVKTTRARPDPQKVSQLQTRCRAECFYLKFGFGSWSVYKPLLTSTIHGDSLRPFGKDWQQGELSEREH